MAVYGTVWIDTPDDVAAVEDFVMCLALDDPRNLGKYGVAVFCGMHYPVVLRREHASLSDHALEALRAKYGADNVTLCRAAAPGDTEARTEHHLERIAAALEGIEQYLKQGVNPWNVEE